MYRKRIEISETRDIKKEKIIALYKSNGWSAAEKPDELYKALMNSYSLITAWDGDKLVGFVRAGKTEPMWKSSFKVNCKKSEVSLN